MPLRTTLLLALLLIFGSAVRTAAETAHYLVFELDEDGAVEPVFSRLVELSARVEPDTDEELLAAQAGALLGESYVTLQLLADTGRVVHQDVIELPRWIRGEFHGDPRPGGGWEIDSRWLPVRRKSFVVRVPVVDGTRLVIDGATRSVFDLDELAARSSQLHLSAWNDVPRTVVQSGQPGDPNNRVDVLIMGDGYTAAEEGLFNTQTTAFATSFFEVSPYLEYRNFVNVTSLFVASPESGADHPPFDEACAGEPTCCGDPEAMRDPLAGTFVDTVFNARYCASDIQRLLVVDESAVLAAASAVPDWDKIMVVVNDGTYGGSGGLFSVTSAHQSASEIARHEFGHSFTGLADEYDTPFPGYPPCSDISGSPCEANVTDEANPGLIKWSPWIAPTTPIPTPENTTEYVDEVGLFEGARYLVEGMYRPRDIDCLMQRLGNRFGQVCSQEYVLTLYRGGWGAPASGIDAIEPGSESPPTALPVDGTGGITLSVDLLQPLGAPPLNVTWLVDDVPQSPPKPPPGTFHFEPAGPGTYHVEIRVEDVTPLVHPDMADTLLLTSRIWTVEVNGSGGPGRADDIRIDRSATTPGNLLISWSPSCSPDAGDYAIYEGTIGDYYSHTMKDCSDDDAPMTEEIQPASGNRYYLVVPLTTTEEGSYGQDSNNLERPTGTAVCNGTHSIAGC